MSTHETPVGVRDIFTDPPIIGVNGIYCDFSDDIFPSWQNEIIITNDIGLPYGYFYSFSRKLRALSSTLQSN